MDEGKTTFPFQRQICGGQVLICQLLSVFGFWPQAQETTKPSRLQQLWSVKPWTSTCLTMWRRFMPSELSYCSLFVWKETGIRQEHEVVQNTQIGRFENYLSALLWPSCQSKDSTVLFAQFRAIEHWTTVLLFGYIFQQIMWIKSSWHLWFMLYLTILLPCF